MLLILTACLAIAACKQPVPEFNDPPGCAVHADLPAPDPDAFVIGDFELVSRATFLVGDYSIAVMYTLENHPEHADYMPARLRIPNGEGAAFDHANATTVNMESYTIGNPIRYISRVRCNVLTVRKAKAVNHEINSHVSLLWVQDCAHKIIYDKYILTVDDPRGGRFVITNPIFSDGAGIYFAATSAGVRHGPHSRLMIYHLENAIKKYESERAGR